VVWVAPVVNGEKQVPEESQHLKWVELPCICPPTIKEHSDNWALKYLIPA